MNSNHGPYHRLGAPGGPGCTLTAIPISFTDASGAIASGQLVSAPIDGTEVEILRSIAHKLGIQWGHDEFGWWAVVRDSK